MNIIIVMIVEVVMDIIMMDVLMKEQMKDIRQITEDKERMFRLVSGGLDI